jgi:pimeloyl-ACP methyl ester carboxylesterase
MKDTMISFGPLNIPTYIIGEENNPKKILYLHGSNTSRERQIPICKKLNATTNRTIILPEYSGHGEMKSQVGQTTPSLHALEAITVYDWINKTSDEKNICVYGGSYGAYLAAQLCKYRNPGQLILQAPSILLPNEFYTPWSILNNRKTTRKKLTYEELLALRHPLMVRLASSFHGAIALIEMQKDDKISHDLLSVWRYYLPKAQYYLIKNGLHSINDSPKNSQDQFLKVIAEAISS